MGSGAPAPKSAMAGVALFLTPCLVLAATLATALRELGFPVGGLSFTVLLYLALDFLAFRSVQVKREQRRRDSFRTRNYLAVFHLRGGGATLPLAERFVSFAASLFRCLPFFHVLRSTGPGCAPKLSTQQQRRNIVARLCTYEAGGLLRTAPECSTAVKALHVSQTTPLRVKYGDLAPIPETNKFSGAVPLVLT